MFCPKCGSILIPKNDGNKKILHCKCGHNNAEDIKDMKFTETLGNEKKIEVVDKEIETHPLTEVECPKCHHREARYWTQQTRASDEPETKFYKCEKCKHIWRDYS
ncbi:transcription factor S [Candidatus Woesearchaeota archaeon]|jgi:transcription factor S|nr:transcription factor S [Candidatus Woesearchaeota archaeon]MBT5272960.1 transcription factor S [Candidatus Woesearchaeota archaeon]MBT6041426.1 transcription factor S [Candidatus Woesearchaeota archaeon]MBT6337309.1 transcription factor S [Candidatus Woesearchaeota archaeon]MBT7927186.1 transcription factor S [Candidatus Woesearchaeota archaeon]